MNPDVRYVYYATVTHADAASALMTVKWFTVINITFSSLVGTPVQVQRLLWFMIYGLLTLSVGVLHLARLDRI
jgi:hypothetical protein